MWPTLETELHQAWQQELADVVSRLSRIAPQVSVYAGGGGPAHQLREAARVINETRNEMEGLR